MKRKLLGLLIFTSATIFAFGQDIPEVAKAEIPYYNNYISSTYKKDSTGYWAVPTGDTTKIVFMGKGRSDYKVYNRYTKQLVIDGELGETQPVDYIRRSGKWLEYYDNGNLKTEGYFLWESPFGNWKFYYENGKLKESYIIGRIETDSSSNYCMIGPFQQFYENGQIKVDGFFKAKVDSGYVDVDDVDTGTTFSVMIKLPVSQKYAFWHYYKENGELEKTEDYFFEKK